MKKIVTLSHSPIVVVLLSSSFLVSHRKSQVARVVGAMLPAGRHVARLVEFAGAAPQRSQPRITALRRFVSSDASQNDVVDVCVVGGGVVGTALACLLRCSTRTKHLSVTLVDKNVAPSPTLLDAPPEVPDARVSALTPVSVQLLRQVGAWDRIKNARARPFTAMQVWDARAAGHVRYDSVEVGAESLGHVVENRLVHAALAEAAEKLGVVMMSNASVDALSVDGAVGAANENRKRGAPAEVHLRNETTGDVNTIKARVVIGADGAASKVRTLAGIRAPGWPYNLKAVCGTVRLDRSTDVAFQRFLPNGPLAVLPCTEDPHVANVVWTNTPQEADRIVCLSDQEFAEEVDQAFRGVGRYDYSDKDEDFGDEETHSSATSSSPFPFSVPNEKDIVSKFLRPGVERVMRVLEESHKNGGLGAGVSMIGGAPFEQPPSVVSASGKRGAFPLATKLTGRHVSDRLALVGDAAHQVHPLGGQGVNLGLRDVTLLHDVFCDTVETGGDIGSSVCLSLYEHKARRANVPMMAALDGLQKLFAVDSVGVAWARGVGLAGVNGIGPLRREIAKYAMGGA